MDSASQIEAPQPADSNAMPPALTVVEVLELLRRLAESGPLLPEGLDSTLTLEQAAQWLQMKPSTLAKRVKDGFIPAVLVDHKSRPVFRFHPRTILEKSRYITAAEKRDRMRRGKISE